jgi:hypothetical protein
MGMRTDQIRVRLPLELHKNDDLVVLYTVGEELDVDTWDRDQAEGTHLHKHEIIR